MAPLDPPPAPPGPPALPPVPPTAFSPTDTLILSRRAKVLMMVQSLIAVVTVVVIAARAINTLG